MLTVDLERIKQEVDLLEHIEEVTGSEARRVGKQWFINPCPSCGGNDHFAVACDPNGEWYYNSFGAACEAKGGSIFDFMMKFEGATSFTDALQKLKVQYPYIESFDAVSSAQPPIKANKTPVTKSPMIDPADVPSLNDDFLTMVTESSLDYFASRGISTELQRKYMLGSHPQGLDYFIRKYRDSFSDSLGKVDYKYFIPVFDPNGEIHYFLSRFDGTPSNGRKYHNLASRPLRLFNDRYLTAPELAGDRIFIAEGVFDALTFEELGYHAIGLNGSTNTGKLIEILTAELNKSSDKYKGKTFVIAGDNDPSGKEATKVLQEFFSRSALDHCTFDLAEVKGGAGYKDANEFLQADRDGLAQAVTSFVSASEAPDLVINYMDDYIKEIRKNAAMSGISTGFIGLDKTLGGGIFPGMYTIGAISSLGKTTLILQIADHIAASGQDVIFFSLEMGKAEVVSKSFSRITSDLAYKMKDPSLAYNTRAMLMNKAKPEVFERVFEHYLPTAQHMSIVEGNFRTDVNTINDYVRRHMERRKTKPVVIVDYLQILRATDDRMSDKQAIDRNIVTLKQMSRDLDIPVILISSFNRANYNEVVSFSSFKESGAVEYSSDVVIGLQLHAVHQAQQLPKNEATDLLNEAKNASPRRIELVILKNRNGSPFARMEFDFYAQYNRWAERLTLDKVSR